MPLILFLVCLIASTAVHAATFSIVALADMPYGDPSQSYPRFARLIEGINDLRPRLVLHLGDTKSGGAPCTDAVLDEQLQFLGRFGSPTLYTPGDNEWTDCHQAKSGRYDPRERLAYIRRHYFPRPGTSFGSHSLDLTHQGVAGYPENARTLIDEVMFVTVHVVGTNNNLRRETPAAVEEFHARDAANRTWLPSSFAHAKHAGARAIVIGLHANMFNDAFTPRSESWVEGSGYRRFGEQLRSLAGEFARPVLVLFGDHHRFRLLRPFPRHAPLLTAVEVFGAPDYHAVEVLIDTNHRSVFAFRALYHPDLPTQ